MKNKNQNLTLNVKVNLNNKEYIIEDIKPQEIIDCEAKQQDNNLEVIIKKVRCECVIRVVDK